VGVLDVAGREHSGCRAERPTEESQVRDQAAEYKALSAEG